MHLAVALLLAPCVLGMALPRVLITDGLAPAAISALSAGSSVTDRHYSSAELADGVLAEYDAVIIRSATVLSADAIRAGAAGRLRVIGRAGVGVDNIELGAAAEGGCWVLNTPGASTASVVELTIAHLLAAARGLQTADYGMKSGKWLKGAIRMGTKGGPKLGHELAGKRLGMLGFGRAARGVARVASALGMEVHANSPRPNAALAAELGVTIEDSVEALFSKCRCVPHEARPTRECSCRGAKCRTQRPPRRKSIPRASVCTTHPPIAEDAAPSCVAARSHVVILCALTDETRELIDHSMLERMPQQGADGTPCGSHLVNMARGGIVVEEDVSNRHHWPPLPAPIAALLIAQSVWIGPQGPFHLITGGWRPRGTRETSTTLTSRPPGPFTTQCPLTPSPHPQIWQAAAALSEGLLQTYSTDVFSVEPPSPENPLLRCDGFSGTPHVGGATLEAQARVGLQIADAVLVALGGDTPSDGVVVARIAAG